ncbi:hypothetical protein C8Q80DRAFT_176623 [Daedaleopsis nitida]|nr:hypothetical protein C8Q80DRAFT_176623 [Daedaleopsis nitida]
MRHWGRPGRREVVPRVNGQTISHSERRPLGCRFRETRTEEGDAPELIKAARSHQHWDGGEATSSSTSGYPWRQPQPPTMQVACACEGPNRAPESPKLDAVAISSRSSTINLNGRAFPDHSRPTPRPSHTVSCTAPAGTVRWISLARSEWSSASSSPHESSTVRSPSGRSRMSVSVRASRSVSASVSSVSCGAVIAGSLAVNRSSTMRRRRKHCQGPGLFPPPDNVTDTVYVRAGDFEARDRERRER